MTLVFETPNAPRAKPAPKLRRAGNKVVSWNASTEEKNLLKEWIKEHVYCEREILPSEELHVEVFFYMPIPRSGSQVQRNLMEWDLIPHIISPDCDNCSKFSCDVANEVVWPDDRQITSLSLKKRYDANPRVKYTIHIKEKRMTEITKIVLGSIGQKEMEEIFDRCKNILSFRDALGRLDSMTLEEKKDFLDRFSIEFSHLCCEYGRKMHTISKKVGEEREIQIENQKERI